MFLLFKWAIFRFQQFVFRGIKWQLHPWQKKNPGVFILVNLGWNHQPSEPPSTNLQNWCLMSNVTKNHWVPTPLYRMDEWIYTHRIFFPFWSWIKLVVWVDVSPLDQRGMFRFHASFPGCTLIYHDLHRPSNPLTTGPSVSPVRAINAPVESPPSKWP